MVTKWQASRTHMAHWAVQCKFCKAEGCLRYGTTPKGLQRFLCKSCRRTFVDNNAPPGMKFPTEVIGSALNLFYESASLHRIRRQLKMDRGHEPNVSNIYRWIVKYTNIAKDAFDDVPINVGDVWVADETVLKLKEGGNTWFFDCIDQRTRFLLASHLTPSRYTKDAQTLMERAEKRAGKTPKVVITDKLRSYLGGIEEAFGSETKHHQSSPFELQQSSRDIERFHGTLKDRTKTLRSLANRESAKIFLGGWLVHYNFFRPHQGLKGRTPAEAAGVREESMPYRSWGDVVRGGGVEEEGT